MEESMKDAVRSGADRFGDHRSLGVSRIDFKIAARDTDGLFALENTFHAKGGPARHLHYEQDEWFFCLEGEFQMDIGGTKVRLLPGDSILGPRKVPHVWAHAGDGFGRLLVVFSPAGSMEAFFREVTKANAMPPQDPALWRAHGMELVGPPMSIE
jgi:mannose-6-phosphate isomerase-like protein (cupin superfamily)